MAYWSKCIVKISLRHEGDIFYKFPHQQVYIKNYRSMIHDI